jgi:EAL domain-containing protein (putative c-di-GMP-specific phosphodiesterase class I)
MVELHPLGGRTVMNCKSCLIEKVEYEVKFEGDLNDSMLPDIIKHLNRRKIEVEVKENLLFIREIGVRELINYCMDHMNPLEISFRINNQEWKPISEIEKVLEVQWVDEIIKEKLVNCLYQPIVNAKEEIFGYEILSRFKRKDGTLVYPNDMFQAAKNRGRLYALDKLCRMTAVRHASSIKNKKAFINFIPTSIYSPEFCLKSTIQTANLLGIDPSQLVFEVVETEQVADIAHLKKILTYYKEKGFDYALDDVGEGYSTLEVLEGIAPAYMKLDIQFVQGVASNPKKQILAKHFLDKALEIGSIPLAEGVEVREDFEWLKQAGYQLFQGYLFGKPAANPIEYLS